MYRGDFEDIDGDFGDAVNPNWPGASVGVRHVAIGAVFPGLRDSLVVALIVAKTESRTVVGKDGNEKWVAHMTLRDSADDTINMTCWVGKSLAKELDESFHVGDVVEVVNARVQARSNFGMDEKYEPHVSSPCCLVFSEPMTSIAKHSEPGSFNSLLSIPTKSSANFYTLYDVQNNPRLASGDFVDILAAVKQVGQAKSFVSRLDGTERGVREVRLFDQTYQNLQLKLWDREWITLSEAWRAGQDVVYLADVRVDRDQLRNCNIVTATRRTVITTNPSTEEARLLAEYASQVDISPTAEFESSIDAVDYRSITRIANVITLQDVIDSCKGQSVPDSGYTAIVYGFITKSNVDEDSCRSILQRRCKECRFPMDVDYCKNEACTQYGIRATAQEQYWMKVDVTDFTGTLQECVVSARVIDHLVCPIQRFTSLTPVEKSELKWQTFLEPMKIWFLVQMPSAARMRPRVVILNCSKISMEELAAGTPTPPDR